MPLLKVTIPSSSINNKEYLISSLSEEVADLTSKPEEYVMIIVDTNCDLYFSKSSAPSCFVELKSIGSLEPSLMSKSLTDKITKLTGIPPSRVYINFHNVFFLDCT